MTRTHKVYIEPAQATASCGLLKEIESKAANGRNEPNAWSEVDDLLRNSPPEVLEDPYKRTRNTALQLGAKYGRVRVVSDLLTREEFVKIIGVENERGETALHLAAKGGHHEIVKQLIRYCEPSSTEPFVNHKSRYSKSELAGDEGSQEVVSNDNKFGYIVYVVRLLSFENTQPKAEMLLNTHKTALHYASAGGHLETVKYLLSIPEVDARLADREENTALHLAISENNKNNGVDGLGVLKELLAAPKVNVNHQDSLGDTPLHKAIRKENIDAVELLCRQNRLIATKRNRNERTPLRLAWELQLKSSNKDILEIVKNTLLDRTDVRKDEEEFKSERESLFTAINALLVGGTLLASITYGGILEMPTLPPEEHFVLLTVPTTSARGTPVPAQEVDFKDRQLLYVRAIDLFRGSNNMCFFLAVITLMLAIQVPISRRRKKVHVYVEEEVEHLRNRSILVSFCLTLSTFFAGVAFVTGGLAKVPVSESGWSLVLSRWVRKEWKLLFQSTMLTTDLSMGCVLFIILVYTVSMDYFFIVRYQMSKRFSLPSLATFLFTLLLFFLMLVVVVLLIFGSGIFQHYYALP